MADEVWIATALLHREHPDREDFTIHEIVERVASENIAGGMRPGVVVHAYLHCTANKEPSPTGYRMLYATGPNTRGLLRPTDQAHPLRKGKITPRRDQIPARYQELLDWYEREYAKSSSGRRGPLDAVLALRGLGAEIWQDVDPDEYVRRLREGWD
ncbi:MAG: hypothetical protein HY236_08625 [Acidobacteria bacterium]|nr:hypothetical protein [Acidobacteriota bacterium]